MLYQDLAMELQKNIQIMTNTFEGFNLQVLNIACDAMQDNDDADFWVLVELASIKGSKISRDVTVKINFYDSDGTLFLYDIAFLWKHTFRGYDTIRLSGSYHKQALLKAAKGRLYAV